MIKREAFKISTKLLGILRELKKEDGHTIVWHLERAVENYLTAKKVFKIER